MPAGPKRFLYGIVMGDDLSIAYLGDPASERLAGYRIGDAVAGGTIQAISRDDILLKRSDCAVDVHLRPPLTWGRDKEQFRIRASWEGHRP